MDRRCAGALVACLAAIAPSSGRAQERILTLETALRLARERAPELRAARARIAEAEGRRAAAAVPGLENPELEIEAGPRDSGPDRTTDRAIGLMQALEPGGRRRARIDAAAAGVERQTADSRDLARLALGEAAGAFHRALHAERVLDLAAEVEATAAEVLRAAEARRAAGDAARLDVSLAGMARSAARAEHGAAEADREAALGELRLRLGLEPGETLRLVGDFGGADPSETTELATLAAAGPERGDVARIEAELRASEAESRLARAERSPSLAFGVRHQREEGADVTLGALRVGLPLFRRGAGEAAEADARARRLRIELEDARRGAAVESRTALAVLGLRRAAAECLGGPAAELARQNDALARLAYEEGQIGLGELLLVRREILAARRARLDRQLEAALAEVDWKVAAGILE